MEDTEFKKYKLNFEKISSIDMLHLFWFYKNECNGINNYAKFEPSQSLIDEYNQFLRTWDSEYKDKPIIWDNNRSNETQYFKDQLLKGADLENWVKDKFAKQGLNLGMYTDPNRQYSGENKLGIEIKHDTLFSKTGNIYIEYQERMTKNGPWTDSGILKKDNTKYWIIGTKEKYFIFKKKDLIKLFNIAKKAKVVGIKFVSEKEHNTSKGFLILKGYASKYAISEDINDLIRLYKGNKTVYGYTTWNGEKYYHHNRKCKFIVNKKDSDLKEFETDAQAIQANYHECLNCVLKG